MDINELSWNVKKTNYMLFTSRKLSITSNDIHVRVDNGQNEKFDYFKFLVMNI